MPDPMLSDDSTAAADGWRNDPHLSEKWKFRFDFFEKYGIPSFFKLSPSYAQGIKQLRFGQRIRIMFNFWAFLFTFIYFGFVLKLWRQALMIFGIFLIVGIAGAIINWNESIAKGVGIGLSIMWAMRANSLYYLKRTQGDIGWQI